MFENFCLDIIQSTKRFALESFNSSKGGVIGGAGGPVPPPPPNNLENYGGKKPVDQLIT